MTDIEIEKLLRSAPRANAPAGLLENLTAQIELVGRATPCAPTAGRGLPALPQNFFRRWFPAISFAAFLLACVAVVAVQTNWISQLRQENKTLHAASANLEQLRSDNLEYKKLLAVNGELERLRKDALEIPKLRLEIEQLRGQLQELQNLRAENRQLLAASKASQESEEEDPFAGAKKKAEAIACINNLKQIGLAAKVWAMDNDDTLPPDFTSMSNELQTVKIVICPSDEKKLEHWNAEQKSVVEIFSMITPGSVSYDLLAPGVILKNVHDPANIVLAHCAIHNSVVCVDGHAEMLNPKHSKLVSTNGVMKIQRGDFEK